MTEIISRISSDHSSIKLKVNKQCNFGKFASMEIKRCPSVPYVAFDPGFIMVALCVSFPAKSYNIYK